jgi:hypothetical protein
MKKTILALSFAAVAAMAASTGASATFYSNGEYYDSGKANYDNGYPDYRTDRHYTEKLDHHWSKHYHWNKHAWYGYRGYCHYHPYSWKCQHGWR